MRLASCYQRLKTTAKRRHHFPSILENVFGNIAHHKAQIQTLIRPGAAPAAPGAHSVDNLRKLLEELELKKWNSVFLD
jgi:hypothetical protein